MSLLAGTILPCCVLGFLWYYLISRTTVHSRGNTRLVVCCQLGASRKPRHTTFRSVRLLQILKVGLHSRRPNYQRMTDSIYLPTRLSCLQVNGL
ncbi:hypothetical protein F4803DRAFT_422249 [Xylaria telfairii]|nr:hypothetical protein F4803DRAFT_422249 [Xylaria telfairii]